MASKSALDSVRYIFQVPLAWFRKVDEWLFGVHPGYLVTFGPEHETAPTIGVDHDLFEREVKRIAGGGESAYTGMVQVCSSVTWDGTNLKYGVKNLVFENGRLVDATVGTAVTVDTPTVITWS